MLKIKLNLGATDGRFALTELETPVEVENWKKWVNLNRYILITMHIDGKRLVLVFCFFFEHAVNHLSSSFVYLHTPIRIFFCFYSVFSVF